MVTTPETRSSQVASRYEDTWLRGDVSTPVNRGWFAGGTKEIIPEPFPKFPLSREWAAGGGNRATLFL